MILLLVSRLVYADTQVDPARALNMLKEQDKQFIQQVVKVTDNVYTAVGYHGANTSMIVGHDGVIIVDTLMGPKSAENALNAFRKYSDKPVTAIIYTHGHPDHTGGTSVFAGDSEPDIYATKLFGAVGRATNSVKKIKLKRGFRQFGRKLPPHEVTNRGLAPAGTIDHDRGKGYLEPTIRMKGDIYKANIAGVDIELHSAPGETDDALFVWLPNEKVLFAGDNFYQAFPNLYAIRGTPYRDVLNWSKSVARMASFKADYLVPGHTMPIKGKNMASQSLQEYSDAIRLVYDQTVEGINQGKSPDLIAHEIELPSELRNKPYLLEFYGTVPHAVRAIYAGLLGWFDGNPATLNRLSPESKAQKMADLAGGTEKLTQQLSGAMDKGEYKWALEIAEHLKWLADSDKELVLKSRITSLRALAAREYNAPNRNYYLSYANELESGQLDKPWH